MRIYVCETSEFGHVGGWFESLKWCEAFIQKNHDAAISIIQARPGEKLAHVLAEYTIDGVRMIQQGEVVRLKDLQKRHGL